jgi:GcrA cell cycle regulator
MELPHTVGDVMESIWTPERIVQLTDLWNLGLSTAEIGRRIGVTKNAVVGKAHRLFLTPRPSPLKRKPGPRIEKVAAKPKVVAMSGPTCSWPIGHPGDKGFRFCDERPVPGKPYCATHAQMAYIRPKTTSAA